MPGEVNGPIAGPEGVLAEQAPVGRVSSRQGDMPTGKSVAGNDEPRSAGAHADDAAGDRVAGDEALRRVDRQTGPAALGDGVAQAEKLGCLLRGDAPAST